MITKRRRARICALQMLYALDNCKTPRFELVDFFADRLPPEKYGQFALELFNGVCDKTEDIDAMISTYAKNWQIDRMPCVDRNIIRIAVYEFMCMPNTPVKVVINEAVEISKRYSSAVSAKFVNGILDKIKDVRKNKLEAL